MSGVDIALVAVRLAIGCWLLWSVRTVVPRLHPEGLAGLSVVVPARDEGSNLPALLGSLPDGVDVVVVDDGSADDTAEVAAASGARVIHAGDLPPGWTGKSWACSRGAVAATGDTYAFVDADVRFGGGGLESVTAVRHEAGGLVSVQPFHEPGTPVESLASIFNIVAFAGTDAGSPLGRRRGARGAFGPVLATSRDDYVGVGGHEAIRESVVDDAALGSAYRRAGLPVTVLGGGAAVGFRMYPGGIAPMVEGFTKNLAAGAAAARRSTVGLVAAWISLLVQAAAAPVVALATGDHIASAGLLYAAVVVQYWWMARRLGRFGLGVAVMFPVSLVLFVVVFARSAWATARGSVRWRGRRVRTGRRAGRRR